MTHVIVIAGPNGAGKSTIAPFLLRDKLGVHEFVNADVLAQGLSAYSPEKAALSAGRIMLKRIGELEESQENFAFETTLATRTFAPKLRRMRKNGYKFKLVFLYLKNENLAVLRVAERVRQGGHHIPTDTINRRYHKGLKNFFNLYQPIADRWFFYENSDISNLKLIAKGNLHTIDEVTDIVIWQELQEIYGKE